MTEKDGGMMTRGRRAASKEITNGVASSGHGKSSSRVAGLETVAEILHVPSTPTNSSQKTGRTESTMSLGMNGSQASGGSRTHSPTLTFSRAQEKEELQNLNDRLAKILNKLSDSEEENKILKVQLKTVQQETSADLNEQLAKYREELGRARTAIDAITHDKDREIMAKDKAVAALQAALAQLDKAKLRADEFEARVKAAEKLARDREGKLADAKAALSDSETARQHSEKELDDVRRQLVDAKNAIEQEVLFRTGLENALKTAEEKAKFEHNLLETKLQRQSMSVMTVDHSTRSPRRSGADFTASVLEMREAIDEAREEIEMNLERMYGDKIDTLERQCDSHVDNIKGLQQELQALRTDSKEGHKDNQQLKNKVSKLEKDLDNSHQKFDKHKQECAARMSDLMEQANETSQRYQQLTEEYRDLKQDNIELTTELEMYNKLLEEEEIRLGITSPNGSTYGRGRKRKRVESVSFTPPAGMVKRSAGTGPAKSQVIRTTVKTSENKSKASGAVRILEVVPGKVIRIENTGEPIVQLSNWTVKQSGDSGVATFKFEPDQTIGGHSIISIYSSTETSVPHDGVTEILAGSPWMVDARLDTVLTDGEGKAMASHQASADSNMEVEPSSDSPRRGGFIGRMFGL